MNLMIGACTSELQCSLDTKVVAMMILAKVPKPSDDEQKLRAAVIVSIACKLHERKFKPTKWYCHWANGEFTAADMEFERI